MSMVGIIKKKKKKDLQLQLLKLRSFFGTNLREIGCGKLGLRYVGVIQLLLLVNHLWLIGLWSGED